MTFAWLWWILVGLGLLFACGPAPSLITKYFQRSTFRAILLSISVVGFLLAIVMTFYGFFLLLNNFVWFRIVFWTAAGVVAFSIFLFLVWTLIKFLGSKSLAHDRSLRPHGQ
jgi:hypothetical protein